MATNDANYLLPDIFIAGWRGGLGGFGTCGARGGRGGCGGLGGRGGFGCTSGPFGSTFKRHAILEPRQT